MADSATTHQYVRSILDTDLYKLTMQQAVRHHFPDAQVKYKFRNRSKNMKFNRASVEAIKAAIDAFEDVRLQTQERRWLETNCSYFRPDYLKWLDAFRFQPKTQVQLQFVPISEAGPAEEVGDIEIEINGLWCETILYETPVMAIVSEAYFKHVDTDWTMDGQEELAYQKGKTLYEAGCLLSEFGARRRRSYHTQNTIMKGLIRADRDKGEGVHGKLLGTSNVHFAQMYDLRPIGTIAHEWTMALGALNGVEKSNVLGLQLWEEVYPVQPSNELHIALTDTFSSEVFFKQVSQVPGLLQRWRGVRQDSGDPLKYIPLAQKYFHDMGIDPADKLIVFSDGLNVEVCLKVQQSASAAGIPASFGVGTFLTNDFKSTSSGGKSKALNIVIKLATINGLGCVKISDEIMKNTGVQEDIIATKKTLGLPI